jgi:protoporphyrinogen oxidase
MTCAYLLAKEGASVDVFEASPHVGGLTRSFELWGEKVDLGPHIFSGFDAQTLALWKELIGDDYRELTRDTRISIAGKSYEYPLKPKQLLRGLGPLGALRAGLGVIDAKLRPRATPDSADYQFSARFGTYLQQLFFAPYCRKLWGCEPAEVDASFAHALVGDMSIAKALRNLVGGRSSEREASLHARFPYAIDGSGAFCERVASALRARGHRVHLGSPVERVVTQGARVTGLQVGGAFQAADWVVSSMPLPRLIAGLGGAPDEVRDALARLRFRSTILVYLRVRGGAALPHLWTYANDTLQAGRITNFAVWQGDPTRALQTIALEYWCDPDDALWRSDDASLSALATRELTLQLGTPIDVLASSIRRIRSSHPAYYRGYPADVARVHEHISNYQALTVVGRGGTYDYDAQARVLTLGIETANHVAAQLGLQRKPSRSPQENASLA